MTGRVAIPNLRGTDDNAPIGAGAVRFFQNQINRGILIAREASL
jgi:hypothetical protein